MNLLKISMLESGYDNLKVLRGITIDIKKNDLAVIIGPNGSGKSTVIKSIFGLNKIFNGEIKFHDKDIANLSPDQIVRLGISYVPQGARVFKTLTVEENLDMGGFIIDDKKEVYKRKEEIFSIFPILKDKRTQLATFLSGGQQQMLAIGRALMLKPELLLLDEPSAGLAPNIMGEIFKIIKEINNRGTTIILVEQNAKFALEICNKAFILTNGEIALKGGPDLINNKRVKDLYLGH